MKRVLILAAAIALLFPAITSAEGLSTPAHPLKRLLIHKAPVRVQCNPKGGSCKLDGDCCSHHCLVISGVCD